MISCLPVTNFQRLYIHVHKSMFGHKCFLYHIQSMCTNLNSNTCCNINIYIYVMTYIIHVWTIYTLLSSTKKRQKKNIALWPGKPTACKSPLKNWLGLEDDFLAGFLLWGWFYEGANYMSVMWNFREYPTANLSHPRCQSISALASSSSACWSSRWISKTSTPGGCVCVFWAGLDLGYWGFWVGKNG